MIVARSKLASGALLNESLNNFMTRYLLALLIAIATHCSIFLVWSRVVVSAQLPLQTGSQALSIQLKQTNQRAVNSKKAAENREATPFNNNSVSDSSAHTIQQSNPIPVPKSLAVTTVKHVNDVSHIEQISKPDKEPPNVESELMTNASRSLPPEISLPAQQVQGVRSKAVPQSHRKPKYPRRAVVRNQQGRVEVSMWIDTDGLANQVKLLHSSGHSMLDQSVMHFIEQEKFHPAMRDGTAVASSQVFSFRFEIN